MTDGAPEPMIQEDALPGEESRLDPQPEWQGMTYEPPDTAFSNRDAECSVVLLAMTIGPEAIDDLRKLNEKDFFYDDTRFVFCETLRMIDAGYPTGDKAAIDVTAEASGEG